MEAAAGGRRDWYQFGMRLATSEEIGAEQANRKAKQEEAERERAEWWTTRKASREIRGSCNLFAVAQKQRRKSEMLLGRAWDGGDYVIFEAVDGAIRSRQTFSSKVAATRAYNTTIAIGYTELNADEERFDRLCPALVQARLARTKK